MLKKILIIAELFCFLLCFSLPVSAEEVPVGYSEWSTEKSGDENEISAVQYGRKLPLEWSKWSTEIPASLFQKTRVGKIKKYAYEGKKHFWTNALAKDLFVFDYEEKAHVAGFFADVDTYIDGSYENYEGPPLYIYCDGKLVASIGRHGVLDNWYTDLDCDCSLLKITMDTNDGEGRNMTSIVDSYSLITRDEYSYVVKWSKGQDWRFEKAYKTKYGEKSQKAVTRKVYSHPLTYSIAYDLDEGKALGELKTSYTVLDEVEFPSCYKKGYTFTGWSKEGQVIEKIEKGTTGDLSLLAMYQRKKPVLSVGYTSFEESEEEMAISAVLNAVNALAEDELDGDLSDQVVVTAITYLQEEITEEDPVSLKLSLPQKIRIDFSVTNSGNKSSECSAYYYILGKNKGEKTKNDYTIYSRYIDEDNKESLNENSIWRQSEYQNLLNEVYEIMKGA